MGKCWFKIIVPLILMKCVPFWAAQPLSYGGGGGQRALPLIIFVCVHIGKENVLLNIHVNLVYKKLNA